MSTHAQTRVVSHSRAMQAVVIEHQGELRILKAADRTSTLNLIVERVGDHSAELRFTGLPAADVVIQVVRGTDLVELSERLSRPRVEPAGQSSSDPVSPLSSVDVTSLRQTSAPR